MSVLRRYPRTGRPAGPPRPGRTPGERGLVLALVAVAVAGAAVATGALGQIGAEGGGRLYPLWIAVAGAAGGAAGAAAALPLFGHGGMPGVARAIRGVFVATIVAALVAGTLALPLWGTMFGPFILAVTLIGKPALAALWAGALAVVGHRARGWRAERESIFRPLRR